MGSSTASGQALHEKSGAGSLSLTGPERNSAITSSALDCRFRGSCGHTGSNDKYAYGQASPALQSLQDRGSAPGPVLRGGQPGHPRRLRPGSGHRGRGRCRGRGRLRCAPEARRQPVRQDDRPVAAVRTPAGALLDLPLVRFRSPRLAVRAPAIMASCVAATISVHVSESWGRGTATPRRPPLRTIGCAGVGRPAPARDAGLRRGGPARGTRARRLTAAVGVGRHAGLDPGRRVADRRGHPRGPAGGAPR